MRAEIKKAQAVSFPVLFFKESKNRPLNGLLIYFASNFASITASLPFLFTLPSEVGLLFGFIFCLEFGVDYIIVSGFSFHFALRWRGLLGLCSCGGGRLLLCRFFVNDLA